MTEDKKIEILNEFNEDLQYCQGRFSDEYEIQYKESKFESGEQYTSTELNNAEENGKTAFVTNLIRTIINRVCNPFILNPAKMNISKDSDLDDQARAAIRKELKKIMNRGGGNEATQIANHNQVSTGRGFVHIYSNYLDQTSLVQQIFMDGLNETSYAYVDGVKVDGSDSTLGIYMKEISLPIAKEMYGEDIANVSSTSISTVNDSIQSGMCPVILYYKKGTKTITRNFRDDGSYIDGKKLSDEDKATIVVTRKITKEFVMCNEIVGNEVQSAIELNIPYIPIVPVLGNKDITDDGVRYSGLVKQLFDSQKLTNAYVSAEADTILNFAGDKIIATAEQIKGNEEVWANPGNLKNKLQLYNQTKTIGGENLPAPTNTQGTVNTSSLIQSKESAKSDMQKESGVFDSQLGNYSNGVESEGSRESSTFNGEIATAQYIDNLYKSLQHITKILISYMRISYVEPRKYKNGKEEFEFNFAEWNGDVNDIDIDVNGGNSTKQQSLLKQRNFSQLATMYPEAASLFAVEMLDCMPEIKNKDELITKLKKGLPEQFQDVNEDGPEQPDPEAIAALEAGNATIEEQKNVINLLSTELVRLDTQAIDSEKDRAKDLAKTNIESMTKMSEKEMDYMEKIDLALIKVGKSPIYGARIVGGKADENVAQTDGYNQDYANIADDTATMVSPEMQDVIAGDDVVGAETVINKNIDEDAVLPDIG